MLRGALAGQQGGPRAEPGRRRRLERRKDERGEGRERRGAGEERGGEQCGEEERGDGAEGGEEHWEGSGWRREERGKGRGAWPAPKRGVAVNVKGVAMLQTGRGHPLKV